MAKAPVQTVSPEEFAKLQAQLLALQAENEVLKQSKLGKAPSFYWKAPDGATFGINELIRAVYLLHPDSGSVNYVVCSQMGFPLKPLTVNDCCNQAQRHLDISKMTEEEKGKAKKEYLAWGRKPVANLNDVQKAAIEEMFKKVPVAKPA